MILFESERLTGRQLEEKDLENFYRLNSDAKIMRYIRKPRTREECIALINETQLKRKNKLPGSAAM